MPAIRFGEPREITSDKIKCKRCLNDMPRGSVGRYEHMTKVWHCTDCAKVMIAEHKPLEWEPFLEAIKDMAASLSLMARDPARDDIIGMADEAYMQLRRLPSVDECEAILADANDPVIQEAKDAILSLEQERYAYMTGQIQGMMVVAAQQQERLDALEKKLNEALGLDQP